ncbi:MAG TPA: histidinol-phosphate transaminase [Stellaceae bacterium]|nr:histidinol-phosphate transaminase [Stellaceae bacterium]
MGSIDAGSNPTPWLTAAVRSLPSRGAAASAESVAATGAKVRALHLNESPYPPSPRVQEAIAKAAGALNRYPDRLASALAKALAERTGIPAARIVFGAGSEELIGAISAMCLATGDRIVVPAPSFPVFGFSARLRDAMPVRAKLDAEGANDASALLDAIAPKTRVVVCCTPNPPSGGMMRAEALERVIAGVPAEILLVVDEAYHEFGRHAGGPDVLALVRRRAGPWVVLRTFSKAYGLAGQRLGYALCASERVAEALLQVKLHFSATTLSQAAALAALSDDAYLAKTLDAVARERERMSHGLRELGLRPWPSAGNFVSVAMPMPATAAMAALAERGILVRDWRDPEYLHELRITVGLPEDTDALLAAIGGILGRND